MSRIIPISWISKEKEMKMWKEFKEFMTRGNVVDLAVGIIIGSAFGKIVTSLVSDIIMPPIGLLLGKVDFSNLYINLSGQVFSSLAEAKAAGAPTMNIGIFINTILDFIIIGFVIFLMVRAINKLKRQPPPPDPTTKSCPFCLSVIPIKAVRCPHCTSDLSSAS